MDQRRARGIARAAGRSGSHRIALPALAAALAITTLALPAARGTAGPSTAARTESSSTASGSPVAAPDPLDDPELRAAVADALSVRAQARSAPMVPVEVLHQGADGALGAAVRAAGGRVTGTAPGWVVQAVVPVASLPALAAAPGVTYLRSPRAAVARPAARQGAAHAAAIAPGTDPSGAIGADAWHGAGITGSGVKVGVLDFFDHRIDGLPGIGGTFCRKNGIACGIASEGVEHGAAVLDVARDIAPGATYYLASATSISDVHAAIDWFAANGVRVVNSSLGFSYDGPGDGTGPLADAVAAAAARGITWINAAGNEGFRSYWRGTASGPGGFDGNGYFRFPDGTTWLSIDPDWVGGDCGFSTYVLAARWSDWGPPETRTDYDVELWEGWTRITTAGPDQQQGAPPVELQNTAVCTGTDRVRVRIRAKDPGAGTEGDVLEVQVFEGSLRSWQAPYSAANPIVDSAHPAVVAVGALDDDSRALAYYSSQGPTNDQRPKPDVSAVACLASTVYAPCFDGTSAATPVVSGAAALYLSAGLAAGAVELATLITHNVVDRGLPGHDNEYGAGEVVLPPPPGAVGAGAAAYTAVAPVRLLDSRPDSAILPAGVPLGPYPSHTLVDVPVAGPGLPVPADAIAVAINVTNTLTERPGYLQTFPTFAAAVGGSSTLNLASEGQTLPNFAIVPVGSGGRISLYTDAGGAPLIDVLGYFRPAPTATAGRYQALAPRRVLDTRQADPGLLPGGWSPHVPGAGEVVTVPFRAGSGLPDSGIAAVVVNVTGVEPLAPGFVTAWSGVGARPNVSTLNLGPGAALANTAIVAFDQGTRSIALYTESGAHLIVDLVGYVTDATAPASTSGRFVPLGPHRLVDTRATSPLAAGSTTDVQILGAAGVPTSDVAAVSLNVTATQQTDAPGFLTLVPGGVDPVAATVSNLNWSTPSTDLANGAIVPVGTAPPAGRITAFVWTGTHLLLDINGYFTS